MSTISIVAPVDENEANRVGWIENISQHIDAGNDVEFVDSHGNDTEVSRLLIQSAGSVAIWGRAMDISQAKAITVAETGWHIIPGIHGIRAADTTTGIGIHVKL
jgi:hypothetical protein